MIEIWNTDKDRTEGWDADASEEEEECTVSQGRFATFLLCSN